MRIFRRSDLLTHMVAADDVAALDGHKLLKNALANWQTGRITRHAVCIGCAASLADPDAKVGAYLFALPVNVNDLVSTSAFCLHCHETLAINEIEHHATRVLRQLAPGGRFLDAGRR
jgi:hypothetical protein